MKNKKRTVAKVDQLIVLCDELETGLVRPPYRAVTADTAIEHSHRGRTVDTFVLSQGPGYGKFSPISTRRSFLASIPILTPVLSLKILKRFFRLHPFHNRPHINVHFRKISLPVPLHHPEPQLLIETHTFGLGIHSKVPAAYDPGH